MKPIVPVVPLAVWKELYSAAARFRNVHPWEDLDDLDLVGVRDPATGETGYGVVMGSGGTLFGLCLYRGPEGFDIYRRLISGEAPLPPEEILGGQNCLKLEYTSRSDLRPEDLAVIRQLKLKFRGKQDWPEFRSLIPGYIPWFLNEQEARLLTLALIAACIHSGRVMIGKIDESLREDECLVYTPVGDAGREWVDRWEPWPLVESAPVRVPILNLARINAIRTKQLKPDSPWEADVFMSLSAIYDRERPYFARTVVVCQEESGIAFGANVLPPESSAAQGMADLICDAIETHGFLPDSIFVKRVEDAAALAPLGKALGIAIRHRKKLRAIPVLQAELEALEIRQGRGPARG